MSGPVFYNNESKLGSASDLENTIVFGTGRIKIYHESDSTNRILATSFINESQIITNSDISLNLIRIGGMPLSISLCYDPSTDPSSGDSIGTFYALDVIINNESEDTDDNNTAQSPSSITPIFNGTPISCTKIENKYYLKTYDIGKSSIPTGRITFNGVPMSYGDNNELIIHQTAYTINDVTDFKEINFGGTIIQTGLIPSENKYFMIVTSYNNAS